jgi:hypothetical protein
MKKFDQVVFYSAVVVMVAVSVFLLVRIALAIECRV